MKPYRHNGAVLPGTEQTMRDLEAPRLTGYAFLGGTGWLGAQCACGMVMSARTLGALQAAIADHQEPPTCHAAAEVDKAEDENIIDEE